MWKKFPLSAPARIFGENNFLCRKYTDIFYLFSGVCAGVYGLARGDEGVGWLMPFYLYLSIWNGKENKLLSFDLKVELEICFINMYFCAVSVPVLCVCVCMCVFIEQAECVLSRAYKK
jgi:hypothetical protein